MMKDRLYSLAFVGFFILSSTLMMVIAIIVFLLTAPIDRRLWVLHRLSCFWGSLYTWFNPRWNVTVEGREKIKGGTTYVLVSNHQSLVDIVAVYRLFVHFKWVAKEELFSVPFVGWNMRLNRYIRLRRGAMDSIRHMIKDCRKAIREGNSVFIFPEGTRSETGEVRRFLSGAFSIAKSERVPIIPIAIQGSRDALPKKSMVIQGRHCIRVRALDEIPVAELENMSTKEIATRTREIIVEELELMEAGENETVEV